MFMSSISNHCYNNNAFSKQSLQIIVLIGIIVKDLRGNYCNLSSIEHLNFLLSFNINMQFLFQRTCSSTLVSTAANSSPANRNVLANPTWINR